jgi:hypothetical protein
MKKIILMSLCLLCSVSSFARVVVLDEKNSKKNELYVDEHGLYRYKKGEDIYKWECMDIYQKEAKKKCMEARKLALESLRSKAENQQDDTLFTGKIQIRPRKGEDTYYYVEDGVRGKEINVLRKQYYFEKNTAGKYVLFDLTTEEPYTGDMTLGSVVGLSPIVGHESRFLITQKYANGLPDGNPIAQSLSEL